MKNLLSLPALVLLVSACNPQQPVAGIAAGAAAASAGNSAEAELTVVNWGDRSTRAGIPFNVQADGQSGIYFELSQPVRSAGVNVSFDGKPLDGVVVNGSIVTATIPSAYLAEPGSYPLVLELQPAATRIEAGDFQVVQP